MDWLGVARRADRIECACGRDHRAKRASNFSHAFTPAMLQEGQKQAGSLMARLGYDIEQKEMKAVPEFGLPALSFPSRRRQQREVGGGSDLAARLVDDGHHECVQIPLAWYWLVQFNSVLNSLPCPLCVLRPGTSRCCETIVASLALQVDQASSSGGAATSSGRRRLACAFVYRSVE